MLKAVKDADVYAVLVAGWSGRLSMESLDNSSKTPTKNVFAVSSVPYGWLFGQIDAAVHHGGAGSTYASLKGMFGNLLTSKNKNSA